MSSFLASYATATGAVYSSAPPAGEDVPGREAAAEHRFATGAAQGHAPQEIEIFFDGSPWWDPVRGPEREPERIRAAIHEAYRQHGDALFERAGGEFAIALVDRTRRRLLLGVDRMGIGNLCWARADGDTIVFGTDSRAVARHPDVRAALQPQALFDYMYFHMVPGPGSVYRGVGRLRPAERLRVEDSRVDGGRYWMPQFAGSLDAPFPVLRDELLEALREGVRRAATGGGQVGAFLSGGLDSSTVVGLLAGQSSGPVRSFSVGFAAEEYDELEYARLVNRHFGATGTEYEVTPEHIVDAIPLIAGSHAEPFGNSSAVPAYFCARVAREHGITRMLAGDGGDELFGGNPHYARQWIFELYNRLPSAFRRTVCEGWLLRTVPEDAPLPLRKLRSYIEQASIPLPRRLHSWDFMFRTPAAGVFTADFLGGIATGHPDELMAKVYAEPDSNDFIDRLLYFDWQFVLADSDIRKVSNACALAGVEVRYPMLDRQVVDFSLRIPASQKTTGQTLRPFYKDATRGFLPAEVIRKKKHGFGLPFGLWLKTSPGLRDLVGDTLAGLKARNIIRGDFLDRVLEEHRTGHASFYGYVIWDLVLLEQWLQQHRESL